VTVGCIRTTVTPPLASGIYEALLEKAERERNEAIQERERWKMQAEQKWGMRRELEELLGVKDTESDEQFAKGLAALRNLIKERDEYRRNLELVAEDCEAWLNSENDEPSAEFIKLVAKYAREAIK
jgi:hypothetical protein